MVARWSCCMVSWQKVKTDGEAQGDVVEVCFHGRQVGECDEVGDSGVEGQTSDPPRNCIVCGFQSIGCGWASSPPGRGGPEHSWKDCCQCQMVNHWSAP